MAGYYSETYFLQKMFNGKIPVWMQKSRSEW